MSSFGQYQYQYQLGSSKPVSRQVSLFESGNFKTKLDLTKYS